MLGEDSRGPWRVEAAKLPTFVSRVVRRRVFDLSQQSQERDQRHAEYTREMDESRPTWMSPDLVCEERELTEFHEQALGRLRKLRRPTYLMVWEEGECGNPLLHFDGWLVVPHRRHAQECATSSRGDDLAALDTHSIAPRARPCSPSAETGGEVRRGRRPRRRLEWKTRSLTCPRHETTRLARSFEYAVRAMNDPR
jgi:hypothetical protein